MSTSKMKHKKEVVLGAMTIVLEVAMIIALFIIGGSIMMSNSAKASLDMAKVEESLTTSGLKGEIHGANIDGSLFVFTYRNPENFFESIQLPLTSDKVEIQNEFVKLARHQSYLIKGFFVKNRSPIKHINVQSMELLKDYKNDSNQTPYEYIGDLSQLQGLKELTGRVHAIAEEGKVLVMEYVDRIVPVFVTEESSQLIVKNLYRGDLIKIRFSVRSEPEKPTHLSLIKTSDLNSQEKVIEVLDSLVSHHGEAVVKTGSLIRFLKSPQINFNVFGILVEDKSGSSIQFTIANLEKPDVFMKLREKLEAVWDKNLATSENNRNKEVNRKLKVTAIGTYNMIDRGQANPQVLIQSADDVTVEILP